MITFSGGEDPGNYWDKHDTWGTMTEARENEDGTTTYIYPVNDETFSAVKKATAVGFLIKATDYVGEYTGEEPYKPAEATVYGFSFSNTLEDEAEETAAPSSEPVVIETGDVETTTTETESSETSAPTTAPTVAPTEAPAANVVSADVNYEVTIPAGKAAYGGYVPFSISDLLAQVPEGKVVTSVKIYGTSNSSALFANLVNKEVAGADQYGNFANKFGLDEAALTAGAEITVNSEANLGKATTGTTNLVFQNNAATESDIVAKIKKVEVYYDDVVLE
nr:hypothetical protein [Eubacterium sp.]